jgi:hypothetical protein
MGLDWGDFFYVLFIFPDPESGAQQKEYYSFHCHHVPVAKSLRRCGELKT